MTPDLRDVPDHGGLIRDPADQFFGPPPPAWLGRLHSASTTRSPRVSPRSFTDRLASAILAFMGGFMALMLANWILPAGWITWLDQTPEWLYGIGALSLLAFARGHRQQCSYIGEEGAWLVTRSWLLRRHRVREVRFATVSGMTLQIGRTLRRRAAGSVTRHPPGPARGSGSTSLELQWRTPDRRVHGLWDQVYEGEVAATAPGTVVLRGDVYPAQTAAVILALEARYADWSTRRLVATTAALDEAMLAAFTRTQATTDAALRHLFTAGRWRALRDVAARAVTVGIVPEALLVAWAHLELGDTAAAEALVDGRRRMAPVRARLALATGNLDRVAELLDVRDVAEVAPALAVMRAVVTADLHAARGAKDEARAALIALQRDGYDLAPLAASPWPAAPLARSLLSVEGPYR